MGNLLTFLIVGGFIAFSIYRNAQKNKQQEQERQKQQPPAIPQRPTNGTFEQRHSHDAIPQPRRMSSGRQTPPPPPIPSRSIREASSSKPIDSVEEYLESKKANSQNNSKEVVSVTASLAKSAEQDAINASLNKQAARVEGDDEANDYIIDTAEEARKAIIWGELLQRKY